MDEATRIAVEKAWAKCPACRPKWSDGHSTQDLTFREGLWSWGDADDPDSFYAESPEDAIHAALHAEILRRGWWVWTATSGFNVIRPSTADDNLSGPDDLCVATGSDPISAMARAIGGSHV